MNNARVMAWVAMLAAAYGYVRGHDASGMLALWLIAIQSEANWREI